MPSNISTADAKPVSYCPGHTSYLSHLAPDSLVQLDVEADIGGLHHLGGKGLDLLHSTGGALLEGDAMEALVQVDGVLAGHHLLGAALLVHHLQDSKNHKGSALSFGRKHATHRTGGSCTEACINPTHPWTPFLLLAQRDWPRRECRCKSFPWSVCQMKMNAEIPLLSNLNALMKPWKAALAMGPAFSTAMKGLLLRLVVATRKLLDLAS